MTWLSRLSQRQHMLLVTVVSLVIRIWALFYRLAILDIPANRLVGSDVAGWLGIARHLVNKGDLSYWFFGARPPLFPLTVAGVFVLGGDELIAAVVQMVFGALVAPVAYAFALRLFRDLPGDVPAAMFALAVGLIAALDPASVSVSATLLSEPLFNLLFALFFLSLIAYVQTRQWRHVALAGLWLALGMLTRPTAIFLWGLAVPILIPLMKDWWRPALVLVAVGLITYAGWSFRNQQYLGVFTYSTQANYHLLFYRAVSAEHLATDAPVDELYTRYAREVYELSGDEDLIEGVTPDTFFLMIVPDSPAEYAAIGTLARQKLIAFWPYAALGTGVGAYRMFVHTYLLPPWTIPLEIIYHIGLYGLAVIGGWWAFRQKQWALLLMMVLPILYITGLTLVSQVSGMDTRMRTPFTPHLAVLTLTGVWAVLNWKHSRPETEA